MASGFNFNSFNEEENVAPMLAELRAVCDTLEQMRMRRSLSTMKHR